MGLLTDAVAPKFAPEDKEPQFDEQPSVLQKLQVSPGPHSRRFLFRRIQWLTQAKSRSQI